MEDTRILNVTRGFRLKVKEVRRGLENGAFVWVEEGYSVRDTTLVEKIAALNTQAVLREPLADAEIPNTFFRRPSTSQQTGHEARGLLSAARWVHETSC